MPLAKTGQTRPFLAKSNRGKATAVDIQGIFDYSRINVINLALREEDSSTD